MNTKTAETKRGTVIEGKYRLERELGAGGMGAVWLATQLMVDREVAVKLLHPAFLDQDDLQARFEVEAKAIGRLNHPNCITLYDFGYSEELGAFYTVIEYIKGVSLDRRLGQRMALDDVVSIIKQVAMALGHAHHQGILHRDLKPENIMLAEMTDGTEIAKVLDFGIARIVKGDQSSSDTQRITKAGEVFGTPAYMSPEQARSVRELTPATDLYALGVMFYELVVGRLPFFAESAFDILMMHVTKPVPAIVRADVPEEVKRIIYRLLEKEPEKRFQTCKDLILALKRLDLTTLQEVSVNEFEAAETEMGPNPLLARGQQGSAPTILGTEQLRAGVDNSPTGDFDRGFETLPPSRPWGLLLGLVGFALVTIMLMAVLLSSNSDDEAEATPVPPAEITAEKETDPETDPVEEPTELEFEEPKTEPAAEVAKVEKPTKVTDPPKEEPKVEKAVPKKKVTKKRRKKKTVAKKVETKPPPKKQEPFKLGLDDDKKKPTPVKLGL